MAKGTKKSPLQQRIEAENARESIRYEKPKSPGGGSLPAGINNGIAKLTRVDFDILPDDNKYAGSQRFYAHGVCVFPVEHNGQKIKGCLVQVGTIVLNDTTPNEGQEGKALTFQENLAKAENRLKLLGFPTHDFEDSSLEQDVLDFYEENQDEMYFSFRTWEPNDAEGKPSGRVLITLVGTKDYKPTDDDDEGVEDDTQKAPAKVASKPSKPVAKATTKKVKEVVEDEAPFDTEEEVEEVEEEEPADLKVLAKRADKGDKKAQLVITSAAKKAKIDPESDEYGDWDDVAVAVIAAESKKPKAAKVAKEEPEEEVAAEINPKLGEVYNFKVGRRILECEVTKVLKRTQTVNLKCLSEEEEFDEVPWAKLIEIVD